MHKRLIYALPYTILLGLVLVIFRELAFTDRILGRGDTFLYFYPYWTVRDAFFRAGELPLWTPNIFMGAPLLANPQLGALYPPNWLTIGLDAPNAVRMSILLHIAWATLGSYLLARRVVNLGVSAALVSAAVFGLGGYIGAHVEQINQLQGLSWFPWLFLLLHRCIVSVGAWHTMLRYVILLGGAIALQILSGHTQTVFISGVGMALYGFASMKPVRTVMVLGSAGVIALLLASPQLVPTWELVGQSSRSGGLDVQAALSFSLNPFIAARGLLPSYDGKIFSEYIAYVGVIGLVLAVVGGFSPHPPIPSLSGRRGEANEMFPYRRVWLVILLAALFLAVGAYNPLNWWIVRLPGFDLFRVPARWMALYGLSAAVLAGMGAEALLGRFKRGWRVMALPVGAIVILVGASFLAGHVPEEVNGPATPTITTLAAWGIALVAVLALLVVPQRLRLLVVPLVFIELVAASWVMPYNDLVPPEVWHGQRFTISQMLAYTETDENGLTAEGTPPGRILSISGLLFDPGDKATLSARYQELGMTPLEERYSFVAAKMKETLTPNLPLAWGIPSVDGYDGGLLPTKHYNTFMELVYPDGVEVPGDGRLQGNLALEACRGACVPPLKSLLMMDVRYFVTDKVFDVWHEDVAYDTSFEMRLGIWGTVPDGFAFTDVFVLYTCQDNADCTPPALELPSTESPSLEVTTFGDDTYGFRLSQIQFNAPSNICCVEFASQANIDFIHAVTVVNRTTENFIQLHPSAPWMNYDRRLSSDIKLFEGTRHIRAFQTDEVDILKNDLDILKSHPDDPVQAYLSDINGTSLPTFATVTETPQITRYQPTSVEIETQGSGMLVLFDSYYPGWRATVNGNPAPIYRANINFRAVPLPAGESHVIFKYQPWWLPGIFIFGMLAWVFAGFTLTLTWRTRK